MIVSEAMAPLRFLDALAQKQGREAYRELATSLRMSSLDGALRTLVSDVSIISMFYLAFRAP